MFNTSRGDLRVLAQKGLIRIKLGVAGGAVVKQIDAEPVMQSIALLIRSGQVSPDHLAEFRIKMEGAMHAHIGHMSGNPIFQLLQQSIRTNIHEYCGYYLPMNKERTLENLNDFKKIIADLKSGNGRTAADLIMDHVARVNKKMTRKTDSLSHTPPQTLP